MPHLLEEKPAGLSSSELEMLMASFRRKIAADKQLYGEYRAWLYPWYTEPWQAVDGAITARARYYHGEVLRAKHNIAHYIRGEGTREGSARAAGWLGELEPQITQLHNAIAKMEEAKEKLKQFNTWGSPIPKSDLDDKIENLDYWRASSMYWLEEFEVSLSINNLNDLKQIYEGGTYGG